MAVETRLAFRAMEDRDLAAVIGLWQRCGLTRPRNDPERDIAFARGAANAEILVGERDGTLIASVMVGHDGHRGVVYYVSVDPSERGLGFGRQVMAAAETWLRKHGVWKLNLMIRAGNEQVVSFYEALGYETEERIVMSRRIEEQ